MRLLATALALFAGTATASEWYIAEIDGEPTSGEAVIRFEDGDGISGNTGCNQFNGQARAESGALIISSPIATTRRACSDPDVSRQEARLLELLDGSVAMQADPFSETLTLSANGVVATLATDWQEPQKDSHGSDYLIVSGVDATLNIRSDATTKSSVVSHAPLGLILRNLGCEDRPDRTWCRVEYLDVSGVQGWAAAEYLAGATATRRAGAELFDGIGRLDCVSGPASEPRKCDYGIARESDGSGAILIYLADNRRLLLSFDGKTLTAAAGVTDSVDSVESAPDGMRVTVGEDVVTVAPTLFEPG